MNNGSDTAWIVERAKALGFDLCGVVRAEKFPELKRTEEWIARGYAGEMKYLEDERRSNPQAAMSGLRSVIVCALNYNSPAPRSIDVFMPDGDASIADGSTAVPSRDPDTLSPPVHEQTSRGWISRYAWGRDYHEVLRTKLEALASSLPERFTPPFDARIYSDTGPLNERVFAKHAGLGWLGKNTLLLNSKLGSWFFLGAILTTLDIPPTLCPAEAPPADLCGTCTRCIDACPTGALVEPYVMDSRLCISYLTIELRGSIPLQLRERMGLHVFGCDICQDVCPWNRRAPVTEADEFQPRTVSVRTERAQAKACAIFTVRDERPPSVEASKMGPVEGRDEFVSSIAVQEERESLLLPRLEWLASMTQEQFSAFFRGSPIKRTKWRGLVRNACIALGNSTLTRGTSEHKRICDLLKQLSASSEQNIAESAQWALSRIQ